LNESGGEVQVNTLNENWNAETVLREYFALTDPTQASQLERFFDESAVMELPFRPPPAPRRYDGLAVIRTVLSNYPRVYGRLVVKDIEVYVTRDPLIAFAYWNVDHELVNGNRYANRFLGHFVFNKHGQILHVSEFYDPAKVVALFADNPDIYNEKLWSDTTRPTIK
jgi:ketosteroid isomerase-like protein